ncbi:MAG: glycosyltransferase family 2 protein [Acidobacteriota bacterium]|nr:glycosyltransferase family 2 protein [Acidobacteriota bacterium]
MNRPKRTDVLVVIPAYNEERTIGEVIRRTLPYADVCVVNDASRDGTEEIIRSFPEAACLTHERNTHIPRSLLDGMKFALDKGYAYIISMDAGLSHKPEDLSLFLEYPDCDLVIGVRTQTFHIPLLRRFISRTATGLMNMALRPPWRRGRIPRLNDATSGFRRFSRRAAELLLAREMKAKAFDFHTEALALICRNGFSLGEVPISYEFSNSSFNAKVLRSSIRMYFDLLWTGRK